MGDHQQFLEEVASINMVDLPISDTKIAEIRDATAQDKVMHELAQIILTGWPNSKSEVSETLRPYYGFADEITFQNGLLFWGRRVIIPESLHADTRQKVHSAHLGVNACLRRARESVFWPGMVSELQQLITTCDVCCSLESKQQKETICQHALPMQPWQRVAVDLFHLGKQDYIYSNCGLF